MCGALYLKTCVFISNNPVIRMNKINFYPHDFLTRGPDGPEALT